jgi:hypothetical protein
MTKERRAFRDSLLLKIGALLTVCGWPQAALGVAMTRDEITTKVGAKFAINGFEAELPPISCFGRASASMCGWRTQMSHAPINLFHKNKGVEGPSALPVIP